MRLHVGHRAYDGFRPGGIADAPAGHRIGLGHAVQHQGAVVQIGAGVEDVDERRVDQRGCARTCRRWRSAPADACAALRRARPVRRSVYTAPVGLVGLLMTTIRVFGVIAASSCAGVILKPCSMPASTITGLPSASSTMSGYDTQYGAGMMTSSPGLITACTRLKKLCLPPQETRICLARVVQPVVALELGDDRLLQAGRAVDRGVFGEAPVDRGDRRVLDVLRRVEIRLAGAEADDVLAFGLERGGAGGDGEGGGGFDGLYAAGEFQEGSSHAPVSTGC